MGFEIPLDSDYPEHPKVLALIALLGDMADAIPVRLWCWCAKYQKDGIVRGGPDAIEKAVKWKKKKGVCHKALMEVGLVDPDGITVHDWGDWAGRKIDAYEKKKKRQREEYEGRNSAGRNLEEGRNSAGILQTLKETKRNEKKTNETKRNETAQSAEELSIEQLAQDAAFDEGFGTKPDRIALWHKHLKDMEKRGFSLIDLERELANKPRDTEPPWEFYKRLEKANGNQIDPYAGFKTVAANAKEAPAG